MKKREQHIVKHWHNWKLTEKRPAVKAHYDYWKREYVDPEPMVLRRQCECGLKQKTCIFDESVLVPGWESIADVSWYEDKE